MKETQRLVDVVYELRRKCPWDKKQTHRTLIPYLVEEAYETVDAIESGNEESLREELGDLLLQVVLHAELESQKKRFSFEDVAKGIADKMVRRHPHVFAAGKTATNAKDHSRNWTKLKEQERPKKTLLEGTPRALPGLQLAQRYGEIAGSVGFDWKTASQVMAKVKEELGELEAELRRKKRRKAAIELELGDLFFSLANLARHLNIDADRAARKSAAKFADRFTRLEKRQRAKGKSLTDSSMMEMTEGWDAIKQK